jgi:hypothetical protein
MVAQFGFREVRNIRGDVRMPDAGNKDNLKP